MKTKIDKEGRATIPHHVRKSLNLQIGDKLEVITEQEKIIFKKIGETCIICNSSENLKEVETKIICDNCIKLIKNLRRT